MSAFVRLGADIAIRREEVVGVAWDHRVYMNGSSSFLVITMRDGRQHRIEHRPGLVGAQDCSAIEKAILAEEDGELAWLKRAVAERLAERDGFWRACSGCQESVEGCVSLKDYPRSEIFQCQPGGGCRECGGIGVIWDNHDYDADALRALARGGR